MSRNHTSQWSTSAIRIVFITALASCAVAGNSEASEPTVDPQDKSAIEELLNDYATSINEAVEQLAAV